MEEEEEKVEDFDITDIFFWNLLLVLLLRVLALLRLIFLKLLLVSFVNLCKDWKVGVVKAFDC